MKKLLKIKKSNMFALGIMCSLAVALLLAGSACSPNSDASNTSKDYEGNSNQTAIAGEYETIGDNPDMLADGTSGTSVHEGAGDETLQQDRVSGGANTGGVASQNLPELESDILNPQDTSNPAPDLLELGTPKQIPHVLEGRKDCATCHGDAKSEKPLPRDHVKAQISADLCLTCHTSN